MRLAVVALAVLALVLGACGDDANSSPVTLTIVNASGQDIVIYINGEQSSLDAGDDDAITLTGASEYAVLVTGESGGVLYTEELTAAEIDAMDGRLVVSAAVVSPS